jgi:serine/threonine protein kinase
MPPSSAGDDPDLAVFARLLERSRLVPPGDAASLVSGHDTATVAADHLVRAGTLTRYQADKLLAGRWQGLVLGPYRVLRPIGRGGMGVVYLADRAGSPDPVALKVLPPATAAAKPRALARFKREMRIGRTVPRHPHVVATVDSGVVDGVYFLAMEYAPGPTLKQRVKKKGAIPVERSARLFAQAAAGLAAVHSAGVVHRDVSPGNLLLTGGAVKLLDFGVAIVAGEPLPADPSVAGGAGYTMGTLDYIAPEQVKNAAAATAASDLYSLGCSLYFALTGSPPYPGGGWKQKLRWHDRGEAPPVAALNPKVPIELSHLVERLMAKAPADRPASAAEVARELSRFAPADDTPPPLLTYSDAEFDFDTDGEEFESKTAIRSAPDRTVWALIAFFSVVLVVLILILVVVAIRR